jgi:hypothetical protein
LCGGATFAQEMSAVLLAAPEYSEVRQSRLIAPAVAQADCAFRLRSVIASTTKRTETV